MKKPCYKLNVSEIASLIGKNFYKKPEETIIQIIKRNDRKLFNSIIENEKLFEKDKYIRNILTNRH